MVVVVVLRDGVLLAASLCARRRRSSWVQWWFEGRQQTADSALSVEDRPVRESSLLCWGSPPLRALCLGLCRAAPADNDEKNKFTFTCPRLGG